MPDFAYIARSSTGQRVTGTLTAPNERDVLSTLMAKSLFPLEVKAESAAMTFGGTRIKPQLMATTYGQLAGLLRSGVPLLRSLAVLRDQSSHRGLKEVLTQVHAKVEEGSTLADAMLRHPKAFGEMAVNMVRAGGEGGFLEDALERVAVFTEQQEDLKSRTIGAVAYPVFLAAVGTIVVTVLIVFFVPMFEPLFAQLKQRGELPAITEWLLGLSATIGSPWSLIPLLGLVMGIVWLRVWLRTDEGRLSSDQFKLRLPMVGRIYMSMAVSRFCRVLGTLLHNGVPILRSLEISSQATGNRVLGNAIRKAAENISSGQTLAAPLAACGHFPPDMVEMIAVAEESNTLETVLINMADQLERRTWRQLDLFVRFLEPVMLLMLAGVVLVVAIGLLLPVMKMSSIVQ
ncbi:MAG: pilus assembly protein PilC [Planctomycetota bacterium]|nr:MAG: pilus assembly protein PilC [Planctomycetota bacterium]